MRNFIKIIQNVTKTFIKPCNNKPTPLGRWNINDNADIKSIQANYDSCCCSYSIQKHDYNNSKVHKASKIK